MEKKHLINLFWLLVMFTILNGIYWLCAGHPVDLLYNRTAQDVLGFLAITALGIVIHTNLQKYTGETWWTMKDIYNKLKH